MDVQRKGYTLFEVMLVIALVVVIGAISIPFLPAMFADRNLKAAEDLVKARWTKMRTQAQTKGKDYRFGYQENTGKFRIAPDSPEFWDEGASDEAEDGELPGDIQFKSADNSNVPETSGPWTIVGTCSSDGSTKEDGSLALGPKEKSAAITLKMKGATGVVSSEGNRP